MRRSTKPKDGDGASGNYSVGYGRPPASGRFKPGDVGNPKGRPKKKKTVGQTIDEAMLTRIKIEENGRSRTVTAQELIIQNLIRNAARGNVRAVLTIFALLDRYRDSSEIALNPDDLAVEDRQIIEEHLKRLKASNWFEGPQPEGNETNEKEKKSDGADKRDDPPDDPEGVSS